MKKLNKFYLLMWKQWQYRKFRYIITATEILLPIFIGFWLCYIGSAFLIYGSQEKLSPVSEFVKTGKYFLKPTLKLAYTPQNNFTDKIMDKVKLFTNIFQSKGVADEQQLEQLVTDKTSSWMGIVFLNADYNDEKPTKFSYKIRDSNFWNTESLFNEENSPGPISDDGIDICSLYKDGVELKVLLIGLALTMSIIMTSQYDTKGFAGVQMALDMAFIRLRNENFDYFEKKFQAFPHPSYRTINAFRRYIPMFLHYLVTMTSLLLSVLLITGIVEEKESGIMELIKLSGVEEWLIQLSWFVSALITSFISYTIVTIFLKAEFNGPGSAVMVSVPIYLVWICIILYCISNIAFCFFFSAIFHRPTVASSVFILVYFLLPIPIEKVKSLNSVFLTKLMCFFPTEALNQGFQRIGFFETQEQIITWDAVMSGKISLIFVFMMLILDTILYFLLSYYITAINPGFFGIRKSPLFFMEFITNALLLITNLWNCQFPSLLNF